MNVFCCSDCGHINLIDNKRKLSCSKCGGELIDLNMSYEEWKKTDYDKRDEILARLVPAAIDDEYDNWADDEDELILAGSVEEGKKNKKEIKEKKEKKVKKDKEIKDIEIEDKKEKKGRKDKDNKEGKEDKEDKAEMESVSEDSDEADNKKNKISNILLIIFGAVIVVALVVGLIMFITSKDDENGGSEDAGTSQGLGRAVYSDDEESFEDYDDAEDYPSYLESREFMSINGTDMLISYEIYGDDKDYSFEEEPEYMGFVENDFTTLLISFDQAISEIGLYDVDTDIEDGEECYVRGRLEEYIEDISENQPICIYVSKQAGISVDKGISVTDMSGKTYDFYIDLSAGGDNVTLAQYDYSYINLSYFDYVDDDNLQAAHLRGFDNLWEAADYYENDDYTPEWKVLWVVVQSIDASGIGEDGSKVHQTISMSDKEKDFYLNDMPNKFVEEVSELSNNSVGITIDTMLYNDPITYLDEENGIVPDSFSPVLRERLNEYNSVICTARLNDDKKPLLLIDWLGLAYGIMDKSYGFCQVNITGIDGDNRSSKNKYPAEPWIHEWIHTLQPVGVMFDRTVSDPDGAEDHGYECKDNGLGINGFYEYYGDILSGQVEGPSEIEGLSPGMWRAAAKLFDATRGRKAELNSDSSDYDSYDESTDDEEAGLLEDAGLGDAQSGMVEEVGFRDSSEL